MLLFCKGISIPKNNISITLDFPIEKITKYLFVNSNKLAIMNSMGYSFEDSQYVYNEISKQTIKNFTNGKLHNNTPFGGWN